MNFLKLGILQRMSQLAGACAVQIFLLFLIANSSLVILVRSVKVGYVAKFKTLF